LQQTNRSCRFPLVQFSQIENGRPDDFLWSVYRLLILQMEVCRLSVYRRSKGKLTICKRTKRTCQSKSVYALTVNVLNFSDVNYNDKSTVLNFRYKCKIVFKFRLWTLVSLKPYSLFKIFICIYAENRWIEIRANATTLTWQ
jgi:hypothetical protein